MHLPQYSSILACLLASATALVAPAITARAQLEPRQSECTWTYDAYDNEIYSCLTPYDDYPAAYSTPYTPYYGYDTPVASPTYDNYYYPSATPSASQSSSFDLPNIDHDSSDTGSSKAGSKFTSKELTVAAKAGIGVGVSVGAIFLAVCCGCFRKRRLKTKKSAAFAPQANNFPSTGDNATASWNQHPQVETGHTPMAGYFHQQPEMNKVPEPFVQEVPRV